MEPERDEVSYVAAAKSGSEAAWRYLVETHQHRLVRLAWALTGDRELAAEVAQETLVAAFLGIGRLRKAGAFGAWLRAILLRTARRMRRRGEPPPDREIEDARTPEAEAMGEELRRAVDRAIESLAPLYQEALALAMDGTLTSAEAGQLLGCSAEAYRVRVHKARSLLRAKLARFLTE